MSADLCPASLCGAFCGGAPLLRGHRGRSRPTSLGLLGGGGRKRPSAVGTADAARHLGLPSRRGAATPVLPPFAVGTDRLGAAILRPALGLMRMGIATALTPWGATAGTRHRGHDAIIAGLTGHRGLA